ncbi:hypothetical protein pb186bvf_005576 [Paramecium bursaria]
MLLFFSLIAQLGQDDSGYVNTYVPTVVSNTSTNSTTSNIQQFIAKLDAQTCLDTYCVEEKVACQFTDACWDLFSRYTKCYNSSQTYKGCRDPLLNSTLYNVTFQFTDYMECHQLCGWLYVKSFSKIFGILIIYLVN